MSKGKILICDDDQLVSQATRFVLEMEHFEVEELHNTNEIEKISAMAPDLILLDLSLPVEGGAIVLKKLKEDKKTENIPVILFSGQDRLAEICDELKADGYIPKPYEISMLIETVEKWIRK